MDKSKKTIGRRDFVRVVSGTLVAGTIGCDDADPSVPPGASGSPPRSDAPATAAGTASPVTPGSTPEAGSGAAAMPSAGGVDDSPASASAAGGAESTPAAAGDLGDPDGQAPADPMLGASDPPDGEPGDSGSGRVTDPVPEASDSPATPDAEIADNGKSKVYIVKTADRSEGISEALAMFGGLGFAAGRDVVMKPNFNSQYAFPATTHDDTIRTITRELQAAGAGNITLADSAGATTRSSTPTATVIEAKGTINLCREVGIDFLSYDEPSVEWETFEFDGMTWSGGLAIPKMMRSDRVKILLPCCKTHVLADYTFSMKLAAGLPPRDRRGLISDMHTSVHQKVVDINKGFTPDLVVMDAMMCFIDNGPDTGTTRDPGLIVAATDRVALDAVGVAILKAAGSRTGPLRGKIFETPQIARAVEIELGVSSPDEIELIGNDDATISELRSILDVG